MFFLLVALSTLLTYHVRAQGIYDDNFWFAIDPAGVKIDEFSGGSTDDPGESGFWYFYENAGGDNSWFNIWFYNGDFIPPNQKWIHLGFWVTKFNPQEDGFLFIVVNWATPDWSWPPMDPPVPPVPPFDDPEDEALFVARSTIGEVDLNVPVDGYQYFDCNEFLYVNSQAYPDYIWVEYRWEIDDYNPQFISVDLWGENFVIPYAAIPVPGVPPFPEIPPPFTDPGLFEPFWVPVVPPIGGLVLHECVEQDPEEFNYEFGDAPEGSLAYVNGTIGNFPTCIWVGLPNDYIDHSCPSPLFFGGFVDCEGDGNAGWCPVFNPNQYNMDECGTYPYPPDPLTLIDEGLMVPIPLTIVGPVGSENYQPCGPQTLPLEKICETAEWGTDIDIWIDAAGFQGDAFFHLVIDWNQDGVWANDPTTACGGTPIDELVILNHLVDFGYRGPISAMVNPPPDFVVGPNSGYVWARFTLTEQPVPTDWDGSGQFLAGETEDYILLISPDVMGTPVRTWSILLSVGLIILFTALFIRRRGI